MFSTSPQCQKTRRGETSSLKKKKKDVCLHKLTAEVWRPPLMDYCSSSLASIGVGLELVAQHFLLTVVLAHVEHTTPEERSGIHHGDALSGRKRKKVGVSITNRRICCHFTGETKWVGRAMFGRLNLSWSRSLLRNRLFSHLKGPVVSLILPQFSGFTTSASSSGSQSGSGSVPGTQLLNTNTQKRSNNRVTSPQKTVSQFSYSFKSHVSKD